MTRQYGSPTGVQPPARPDSGSTCGLRQERRTRGTPSSLRSARWRDHRPLGSVAPGLYHQTRELIRDDRSAGKTGASGMLLTLVGFNMMGILIDTDDLIDAQGIADLLGLAQRNTVSLYQRRYPEMPKPVIDLGQGRCKLWLRSEIEDWRQNREDRDTR